jgi:predicted RNase H-like HicB family nuclease
MPARHSDPDLFPPTGTVMLRVSDSTLVTMHYSITIEQGLSNFSAYALDFPGCVAAADTEAETLALMKEALEMHIEDLREHGEPIPEPSEVREVEVAA